LLERWGPLAIIVTRPVPVLAETITIVAGASSMRWSRLILASVFGSLTPAFLYAMTGAAVANLQSTALMFGVVLLVASLFWFAGRLLEPFVGARAVVTNDIDKRRL
jgi:membrane protein DedA with SNARE-associated domain